MKKGILFLTVSIFLVSIFTSCVTTSATSKQDQTEFDGFWTKKDASKISNSFFDSLEASSVYKNFFQTYGRKPVIVLGSFEDLSGEGLDLEILKSEIEEDFLSEEEMVEFVKNNSSEKTVESFIEETGADLQFNVTVMTNVEEDDSRTTRNFIVVAELCDVNTNKKLWSSENSDVKKVVKRTVKK